MNSDCRITCLAVLVADSNKNISDKEGPKEVVKIDNQKDIDISKRKQVESERRSDAKKLKTTKDNKNKDLNSIPKKSKVPQVVCTRGQKWEVEDV